MVNQYNHYFNEITSEDQDEMSREERKFVEMVGNSVQLKEQHYKMKLPFKKENVAMPNKQREYRSFPSDVISKGYAKQVPQHISLYPRKERYDIYTSP